MCVVYDLRVVLVLCPTCLNQTKKSEGFLHTGQCEQCCNDIL